MPEIKSIKDGTVINRNPPLFPGNDATTGAAVGSPSMNGIRWTRASSGSGKLASFFRATPFPPFFPLPLEISTPHVCQSHQEKCCSGKLMAQQPKLRSAWPKFAARSELWGADGGVALERNGSGLARCSASAPVDPMCWHCLGNRLNKLFLFRAGWMRDSRGERGCSEVL